MIVKEEREGRAGNGRDRIERSDSHPERDGDRFLSLNGFSDSGSLEKNERKQKEIGDEFNPGRMDEREDIAADRHPHDEADEYRRDPPPNVRDAPAVDEQHVAVDHQFNQDQGRIQNAVGVKEQRDGHRD